MSHIKEQAAADQESWITSKRETNLIKQRNKSKREAKIGAAPFRSGLIGYLLNLDLGGRFELTIKNEPW
jgi:hypothetical protein